MRDGLGRAPAFRRGLVAEERVVWTVAPARNDEPHLEERTMARLLAVLAIAALILIGCRTEAADTAEASSVSLKPGDLDLEIALDESARPGVLADPMVRDLRLTLTRNVPQGVQPKLSISGLAIEGEKPGESQVFTFNLTQATSNAILTQLHIPAGHENEQLVYPIKVVVDDQVYLTMDLIVTKGLAWRIVGPFEGGPDKAHAAVFPPEKGIDLNATYTGKGGKTIRWQPFPGRAIESNGFFNLNTAYNEADQATAYATLDVYAPGPMAARLALGSDDSIKVWHNGKLIHSNKVFRPAEPGQDKVNVTLAKGKNTFLLKVCEGDGGWGYFFELQDEGGKPLRGIQDTIALSRVFITDPVLRLTEVTRTSATVGWHSDVPNVARVVVRKAVPGRALPVYRDVPKSDMVKADPNVPPLVVQTSDYSMRHTATVTGLQPGTRYLISAEPACGGTESERLSFYTAPPEGFTQFLHLRLVCIIFSNVTRDDSLKAKGAKDPVPAAEIDKIKWEMRQTQLFYWVNSGMRMFIDVDYIVDDRYYEIDDAVYGLGYGGKDEAALEELVPKHGGKVSDYDGRIFISIVKQWNPRANGDKGAWEHPFGGGGTIGPEEYPGYGKSAWRGGSISNSGWLFCHEFQHQLDGLYHWSMGPEHLFNHFQPWDDTAHRHGEHWDGNGWLFWEWAGYVTREHPWYPLLEPTLGFRYLANRWGEVVQVRDADNDGIPDDAPRVPLDEKRFGSDPAKADTDGDGLSDMMEVMACRWLEFGLGELWGGDKRAHYCNPRDPDTDKDGIRDGEDPYPIYAIDPLVKKAPNATGSIPRTSFQPFVKFRDPAYEADFYLSWNDDWLAIGMTAKKAPANVRLFVDAGDNGWYVGHDNYDLRVHPNGGAPAGNEWHANADRTFAAAFHNCGVKGKWPFYDPDGLADDEVQAVQEKALDGYTLEIRLPRNRANGLDLVEGQKIGILIAIEPEGGNGRPDEHGALTVFEPHTFFTVKLAKEK